LKKRVLSAYRERLALSRCLVELSKRARGNANIIIGLLTPKLEAIEKCGLRRIALPKHGSCVASAVVQIRVVGLVPQGFVVIRERLDELIRPLAQERCVSRECHNALLVTAPPGIDQTRRQRRTRFLRVRVRQRKGTAKHLVRRARGHDSAFLTSAPTAPAAPSAASR
jgi:hypothetical protein